MPQRFSAIEAPRILETSFCYLQSTTGRVALRSNDVIDIGHQSTTRLANGECADLDIPGFAAAGLFL
jgi:hypothetical protein